MKFKDLLITSKNKQQIIIVNSNGVQIAQENSLYMWEHEMFFEYEIVGIWSEKNAIGVKLSGLW